VLGPLHYLTEIKWLNDRSLFSAHGKNWRCAFVVLAGLMLSYPLIKFLLLEHFQLLENVVPVSIVLSQAAVLSALSLAILMLIFNDQRKLQLAFFIAAGFSLLTALLLKTQVTLITTLLPTVIHVYLFTLLFMIYGYRKSSIKSAFDGLNIALMIVVPVILVILPPLHNDFMVSSETLTNYYSSNLISVVNTISPWLSETNLVSPLATAAMKVKIFLAFAYTYHYLNWFSKTSIIGWWKNSSMAQIVTVLIIWFASMGLYYYNYQLGFLALFFLSFLHVFMEFPLNVITFKELFQKRTA